MPTTERVFQIFKELNKIPRPSHHEERVADYLCQFAERLHLEYKRLNNAKIRTNYLVCNIEVPGTVCILRGYPSSG